ncbi:MAG: MmgE/PrpD family protein [Betaproteobacteria bacterium]|nr:MmgE/PrpD family protein [Betaproteobacteria bacterium]
MAISTGPTSTLCRWACSTRYDDLPAEVRKETVTFLYDQVGGMIASATLPSCQPLVDLVRKLGPGGDCSIVGHPLRTSVTNAALANGTVAHGAEVDSTGQKGTGHYAAITVPVGLTVGQYVSASGKELCRAVAVGSEVAARFQSVLGHHGTRNQFVTSVGATMGAAVSAGLLLGLNAEQMEHALGLAASCACGLTSCHVEELHQTKSLNRGKAVEAGVLAALLAQEGYHGPREIMTIENGFFDAYLGLPEAGHEVVEELGENYLMRQIAYKRYPVGGPNQTPLYAFLQLIKTHKLVADNIEQIEVSVSRDAFQIVMTNMHPSVHMQTILSLAAVYGELTFSHIHNPRYREAPEFKAFQERARIFIIPRPGRPAGMGERLEMGITVRTRNGETLSQKLRYPLMSEAEIKQKFRYLAGLRLDGNEVAGLEKKLMAIEAEKDVASLVRELEIPYADRS